MAKEPLKIVAIGAGSGFGRGVVAELLGSPDFASRPCTLSLVDADEAALDRMHRFALQREYLPAGMEAGGQHPLGGRRWTRR